MPCISPSGYHSDALLLGLASQHRLPINKYKFFQEYIVFP